MSLISSEYEEGLGLHNLVFRKPFREPKTLSLITDAVKETFNSKPLK